MLPELKIFWPAFLDYLIHERPNLGAFLSLAYPLADGNNGIHLKFAPSYRFQFIEVTRKNNREDIHRLLQIFAKCKLELNITVESKQADEVEPNYIKTIGNIPTTIDDEIDREPIIKTVLELFDGEVLT